jgi:hypothetical protein
MRKLKDQIDWDSCFQFVTRSFRQGTFLWALDQMMQGKKVCRGTASYASSLDSLMTLTREHIEATDWELYEEPKFNGLTERAQVLAEDNKPITFKEWRGFDDEQPDIIPWNADGEPEESDNSLEEYIKEFKKITIPSFPSKHPLYPEEKDKCECGSEKAGAIGHSEWCPKFKASDTASKD